MLPTLARLRTFSLLAGCLLLSACSAILPNPLPADVYTKVSVLGRQDFRIRGDHRAGEHQATLLPQDTATLQREFSGIMHTEHHYLAISGGGADGASVLVGWSKLGTGPEFTMVTGVSTGALTAADQHRCPLSGIPDPHAGHWQRLLDRCHDPARWRRS